jgi:hypothetical protein
MPARIRIAAALVVSLSLILVSASSAGAATVNPSELPQAPEGVGSFAPPSDPLPPAEPVRPRRAASPTSTIVQLQKRRIHIPLACQRSGRLSLQAGDLALGNAKFSCSQFRAVATIVLSAGISKQLASRVNKDRVPLLARLSVMGERLSARLKLGVVRPAGVSKAANQFWSTGWLSCGRPNNLNQPGLRVYTPTLSSTGQTADYGWYNPNGYTNWVAYRPYLQTYNVGWQTFAWRGWITVGPYQTISQATAGDFLTNPAQGQRKYIRGAVEVYWYYGFRDWNYLSADQPDFGYPVLYNQWCYIA